jgi:uncharacterized cupredoxin-like copper-binding protein
MERTNLNHIEDIGMRAIVFAAVALSGLAATAQIAGASPGHGGGHAQEAGEAAALGQPGDPKARARVIELTMNDNMRFTPAKVMVLPGETVKFVVKNAGAVKHEMVLGSAAELKEHAEVMKKFPEMEHEAGKNSITVAPGETGTLVWQFTKVKGEYDFGCLVPGHFDAGMVGKVLVR